TDFANVNVASHAKINLNAGTGTVDLTPTAPVTVNTGSGHLNLHSTGAPVTINGDTSNVTNHITMTDNDFFMNHYQIEADPEDSTQLVVRQSDRNQYLLDVYHGNPAGVTVTINELTGVDQVDILATFPGVSVTVNEGLGTNLVNVGGLAGSGTQMFGN